MWDTQVTSPQVHVCEQHMPWRRKWLGDVAKPTHVMMKELIAYETWNGVMWLRWRRSRQDLARQTSCKCEGQVNGFEARDCMWRWSLSKTWCRWTDAMVKSEVKINEPIWSCDDMKWIISFDDWLVHVLHWHRRRWNGMRKAKVYL
jgi:hypothetical protein